VTYEFAPAIEEAASQDSESNAAEIAIDVRGLNLSYGDHPALTDISLQIPKNQVTAFIGPSGCGKSSLLRCFNRMNDLVDRARVTGKVLIDGENILDPECDVIDLRRKVGMVFQAPNPFPMSIFENVVYGLRVAGVKDKAALEETAEQCLKNAALWDEVSDRLHNSALGLSGGQMQRLCIARAIAVDPEVILMDEPCSALDPVATAKVEKLIEDLKERYTVVIVTHNMQQAARVADFTAFLFMGGLVEFNQTKVLFTNPGERKTEDYITGRFG